MITYLIIAAVALLVIVAIFATIRSRQRSGSVLATKPNTHEGGRQ